MTPPQRPTSPAPGSRLVPALLALACTTCGLDTYGPCNDGAVASFELCDDGNNDPYDGCTLVCTPTRAVGVSVGSFGYQTCAILPGGQARCWGENTDGQLGYAPGGQVGIPPNGEPGDAALPTDKPLISSPGGGAFTALEAGTHQACALTEEGAVFCWGAHTERTTAGAACPPPDSCALEGDHRLFGSLGMTDVVPLSGGAVTQLSVGSYHRCAITADRNVSCWGGNPHGVLGLGHQLCVGPCASDIAQVALGEASGKVTRIAAGVLHTCIVFDAAEDNVMCWGYGGNARLGYGVAQNVGDGTGLSPADRGPVHFGGRAIDISVGEGFTCILLDNKAVRCWGKNEFGQLGQGDRDPRGTPEKPTDTIPDIDLGAKVKQIDCGYEHVCALTEDQTVRCWGRGDRGQLGYGNTDNVGDFMDNLPRDAGDVDLGGHAVLALAVGKVHTCVLLDTTEIRCWGVAERGQLGQGNNNIIGDDETPADAPNVPFYPPDNEASEQ